MAERTKSSGNASAPKITKFFCSEKASSDSHVGESGSQVDASISNWAANPV